MMQIPMLDLKREYEYMKEKIDAAIHKCLAHQQWIFGPEIKEFESAVAEYLGVKHCIGVSSGTEALVISLRALAIKKKGQEYFGSSDEIITTPFTFTATGDAILRSGATPVFVDVDTRSYNIDFRKVGEYLAASSGRVVGILPVHLYGRPCEMNELAKIAEEYDLFIVEDVAQAFGGSWGGRQLGSIGTCGAFSFFPSKNLGGFGDGGMIATNDDEAAELARILLKHGGRDKYNVEYLGYNARLDTLQAAVLLAKIGYIDEFNGGRRNIAKIYTRELAGLEGLLLPDVQDEPDDGKCVYHQYTVRTKRRDELQNYLRERGIASMVYYPFPLHKMKLFEGRMKTYGTCENAETAAEQVLSLPIEPLQSTEDTVCVVDGVRSFFRG
jgi:dTDP-4-amino-4,6-dideoxygalactose transaminase